jgi:excisionase family DNA binding protein
VLNKKETAKKLGVSERTITRWMEDRKIPYYLLNGIARFDSEKLDNWIRLREVKQKQSA